MTKSEDKEVPNPPFELEKYHKAALLKLFRCHHGGTELTYPELSQEIGVGEKTKAWQCGAWKDLKTNKYIVNGSEKGKWKVSDEGLALAETLVSDEELAEYRMPETNEEHHEKIKARLMRDDKAKRYGPKIFDYLIEKKDDPPMDRHQIAEHFNCDADSHGFFYGLKALKNMKMVVETGEKNPSVKKKANEEAKEEEDDNRDKNKETKQEVEEETEEKGDKSKEEDKAKTGGGKKKRKRNPKKNKSGGRLLKLSDKAFLISVGRDG